MLETHPHSYKELDQQAKDNHGMEAEAAMHLIVQSGYAPALLVAAELGGAEAVLAMGAHDGLDGTEPGGSR